MKTRQGFVSNSSSSSFIVDVRGLSCDQKEMIVDHFRLAQEKSWGITNSIEDEWTVDQKKDFWHLSTWMDNFDMHAWLTDMVGVLEEKIEVIE
jgi:hypothetical protein